MRPERWPKFLSDYVNNHPFLIKTQVFCKDDCAPYMAVIYGVQGPQGKDTLKNLLKSAGWERIETFTKPTDLPLRLPKRSKYNVYLFNFGDDILKGEQQ